MNNKEGCMNKYKKVHINKILLSRKDAIKVTLQFVISWLFRDNISLDKIFFFPSHLFINCNSSDLLWKIFVGMVSSQDRMGNFRNVT